jgi:hypothetical protein
MLKTSTLFLKIKFRYYTDFTLVAGLVRNLEKFKNFSYYHHFKLQLSILNNARRKIRLGYTVFIFKNSLLISIVLIVN